MLVLRTGGLAPLTKFAPPLPTDICCFLIVNIGVVIINEESTFVSFNNNLLLKHESININVAKTSKDTQ
jgi:hypothetical protein